MSKPSRGLSRTTYPYTQMKAFLRHSAPFRYSVPVITVALAFACTVWSRNLFHHPFLFYYVPVVLSAWLGGVWPGLLATTLSAGAAEYIFVAGPQVLTPDDAMQIALFLVVGVVTTALIESLRKSEKKLQARWHREIAISEAGRRALADDDLQGFLNYATHLVARTLDVEYCKILQLMPERNHFLLVSGVGWKPGMVGSATVEAGPRSQAGYTQESGTPIVVENVRSETRFSAPQLLTDHEVVSGISVTIDGEDGPFGVLGAHSRAAHAFTLDDIHFIQSMANLLAVSIQRRRSTRLITESEARFRALAELIPQMVWTTTSDGMVDYISQSWCRFTGLTMEESLGLDGWKHVLHPEDAIRVLGRWKDSIASGRPYEVECRLRTANGEYRWVLTRAIAFRNADGAVQKWFGTCTDVHSQRLAEQELRKTEKLAATAQIASAMAHEINNPLAAVTNVLYLLHSYTQHGDPVVQAYVQVAEQELARVIHISNQMLGLYREPSRPVAVRLKDVLDRVIEMYAAKFHEKRAQVIRQHFCDEELVAKRGELRHLFSNLLLNALEAVPVGGTIAVRTRSARDPGSQELKGIHVLIADNGPGISLKDRRKIFEPFFTTKSTGGAGLGLWVAESIVREYSGAIRVRSRPAQSGASGTVVSIFLPNSIDPETVQPSTAAQVPVDEHLRPPVAEPAGHMRNQKGTSGIQAPPASN